MENITLNSKKITAIKLLVITLSLIFVSGFIFYFRSYGFSFIESVSAKTYSTQTSGTNRLHNSPIVTATPTLTAPTSTPDSSSTVKADTLVTNSPKPASNKLAYLTFDDGPSSTITPGILDILKKENIKASFFVVGSMCEVNKDILRRTADEGHYIGIHTYSHIYKKIYKNPTAYLNDIYHCQSVIKSILGDQYDERLIRFPGGAFGKSFDPFIDKIHENGFEYINWTTETGDSRGRNVPINKLMSRLKSELPETENPVILMHDTYGKKTTLESLPQIISYLREKGYEFDCLK